MKNISKTRVEYVLICEDIRQELGDKPSAMGIFTDDILVAGFPYAFPKLCFLAHLNLSPASKHITLNASYKFGDGPGLELAKDQILKIPQPIKGGVTLQFILPGLTFKEAGVGTFSLKIDGNTHQRTFKISESADLKSQLKRMTGDAPKRKSLT